MDEKKSKKQTHFVIRKYKGVFRVLVIPYFNVKIIHIGSDV